MMRISWQKIKEDAREGFRILREEGQTILTDSLKAIERVKIRRALSEVEMALQEKYQEVGEKLYRHFAAGREQVTDTDFTETFAQIERLQAEKQQILAELKTGEEA